MIPYGRQSISEADIDAVVAVLRSPWLTQGPAVPAFEAALAQSCQAQHAIAVSSATAALHLACLALDLGPGDWLWTSPNTFLASANCARYCGANVDFVDIDLATGNLCVAALAQKLEQAEALGRLPKIVVPVAFAGQPCDMAGIRQLADRYGFAIIEDAAHALGSTYRDRPTGCGDWADISVLSFHPVKIITTGEGGALLTPHRHLAERLGLLRSHGVVREPLSILDDGPWCYEMQELGYHYRLTDIQAALGISQLQRLPGFVARRQALAARYQHELADTGLALPVVSEHSQSAWHLYVVGWPEHHPISRRTALEALRADGIQAHVHYIPVHLQPYYRQFGFGPGLFPNAETHYQRALTLPLHPALTDDEQTRIISRLKTLLGTTHSKETA